MCFGGGSSSSYTPPVSTTTTSTAAKQEQVAAPTYADASVSKATATTRNKSAALAGRDVRTSARGLSNESDKEKRGLLGG